MLVNPKILTTIRSNHNVHNVICRLNKRGCLEQSMYHLSVWPVDPSLDNMTYASFRLYYGTTAHMYLRILLSITKEQLPSGVTRYVIPHNKPKTIKPSHKIRYTRWPGGTLVTSSMLIVDSNNKVTWHSKYPSDSQSRCRYDRMLLTICPDVY